VGETVSNAGGEWFRGAQAHATHPRACPIGAVDPRHLVRSPTLLFWPTARWPVTPNFVVCSWGWKYTKTPAVVVIAFVAIVIVCASAPLMFMAISASPQQKSLSRTFYNLIVLTQHSGPTHYLQPHSVAEQPKQPWRQGNVEQMQGLCSTGPGRPPEKHCHHSVQHYSGFRFVCYAAMTANFHQDQSGAALFSDREWYGGASQRQGSGALFLWRMVCCPLPPSEPRPIPAQLSSNLPTIYFPSCWAWSHLSIAQ